MRRKISNDEKEEFVVQAFNYENMLNRKVKKLTKKIEILQDEKINLIEEFKKIRNEYNEILSAYTGRGKYYQILVEPTKIQDKLTTLENDIYNCYRNEFNENKAKEFELKKGPLTEDLEEANKNVFKFEKRREDIEDKCIEIREKLDEYRKNIKDLINELNNAKRDQKKLINNIKKVDNAYLNNKKISEKKLELKKVLTSYEK